ncbi:MAG: cell division protein FtsX [Flavobacteriales bacterium]
MAFEPEKYLRRRAQASFISTILGIALVLSMLGIMAWILVNTRQISKKAKEQIFMDINFRESAKEADILQFEKTLKIETFVRKSHYVDRDEIARRLDSLNIDRDSMLTDEEAKSIIPPHVELYLNEAWANPDSAQLIRETLTANRPDIVETITFNENMFRDVNNNVQKLAMVLGGLACVLLLVAMALINNTIRLAIYSKRFIIRTMQLVGATERFIRKPYLWRALLQGFVAGMLALSLFVLFLYGLRTWIPEIVILEDVKSLLIIFGILTLGGILLSWISTYFAFRKYLRIKTDNLY